MFSRDWMKFHGSDCIFRICFPPFVVSCRIALLLLCFLIIVIQASGILISLSLLIINSVVRVVVSLIYLNCLFYPAWVEMGITINKINIVPERVVSGAVGVLWDGGELFISGMDILLMFLDSLLHIFTSFADVSLPARTGNPVEYAIPFGWIDGILRAKLFKEAFDIGQDCGGSELGGGFSASGRCLGFFLSFFLSFYSPYQRGRIIIRNRWQKFFSRWR